MGFFGPSYSQIPGLGGDLAGFDNFDPRGNMLGLGKFGHLSGQVVKNAADGKLDQNAYYNSSVVNPIKSSFAASRGVTNRGISMNPFAIQHPELSAGLQAESDRDMANQEGNAIGAASGNFVRGAGQDYQSANNDRYRNTAMFNQMKLQALEDKSKARQGGTQAGPSGFSMLAGGLSSGLAAFCDERAKENITTYAGGLTVIERLPIVEFDYKESVSDLTPVQHTIGTIAQAAGAVDPGLMIPYGDTGYVGVDLQRLLFTAINAIQELSKEVQSLRERVDASTT